MRYNSIGEYFYKLSNRCLVLALFPVILTWLAFTFNHRFFDGAIHVEIQEQTLLWVVTGTAALQLLILFWLLSIARRRVAKIISEPSLGIRIQKYIPIVMTRFYGFSFMLSIIGSCVFLSVDLVFLYFLPIPILCFIIFWPSRRRISADLKLKSEEKAILSNNSLGV